MRLVAISVALAVAIFIFANFRAQDEVADRLRLGAQIEFMHGMATFACATFMNIGAHRARLAPAFFLAGALLFCGSVYAVALGAPAGVALFEPLGISALLAGWLILAWSAGTIDRS